MDLTGKRLFDNQRLKDFQNCNRYAYWRHERHYTPTRPAIALIFGIAIHEAMDAHYSGGDAKAVARAFKEVWVDKYGNPEGDDKRNLNNGIFILEHYTRENPVHMEPFKVIAIEEGFFFDITDTDKDGTPIEVCPSCESEYLIEIYD